MYFINLHLSFGCHVERLIDSSMTKPTYPDPSFSCNGRHYPAPRQPVVVICIDGFDPAYLEAARARRLCPFLGDLIEQYGQLTAASALPSFTNPNNMSLITGVAPARHGISGNYALDPETGAPVMMNTPAFLRAGTILAMAHQTGLSVGAVTAKDKLRRLLGAGLPEDDRRAVCLSIEALAKDTDEAVDPAVRSAVGETPPDIYSAEVSLAVLRVGLALLDMRAPDLLYLSTTDYMQHRYRPDAPEVLDFMAPLDSLLARIDAMGAMIVVTADHGMNAKTKADGAPDVAYLQDVLDVALPEKSARVILPITDPYIVHHGALGACAMVYLDGAGPTLAAESLMALRQVDEVLKRADAARELELPEDRIGDLMVLATASGVLGTRKTEHDLSALRGPLRSHGGRHEQTVPFIVNRPLREEHLPSPLRNYDAFHVAVNLLGQEAGHG